MGGEGSKRIGDRGEAIIRAGSARKTRMNHSRLLVAASCVGVLRRKCRVRAASRRYAIHALTFALLLSGGVASAAESEASSPELDTVRRAPGVRAIAVPQRFRFAPQADMTTQELDLLRPYLDGKPLHEEDRKTLGPAMRHLREVN